MNSVELLAAARREDTAAGRFAVAPSTAEEQGIASGAAAAVAAGAKLATRVPRVWSCAGMMDRAQVLRAALSAPLLAVAALLLAMAPGVVKAQNGFTLDYFKGDLYGNEGVYNQLPTYYPDPRTFGGEELKHAVATLHNPHYRLTDVIARCGNISDQIEVVVTGSPAATKCGFVAAGPSFPNGVASGFCTGPIFGRACDAFAGSFYLQIGAVGLTTTDPNTQAQLDILGLGGLRRVGFLQVQLYGGVGTDANGNDYAAPPEASVTSLNILPNLEANEGFAQFDLAVVNRLGGGLSVIGGPFPTVNDANYINGTNFAVMPGFRKLDQVNGSVALLLTSLSSLVDFKSVTNITHAFALIGNPYLNNLAGLGRLENLGGGMIVAYNARMTDLKGAELAFTSIGMGSGYDPYAGNSLVVLNNPSLVSLGGLETLRAVGGAVLIEGNPELESLSGLDHLIAVNTTGADLSQIPPYGAPFAGQLTIQNNKRLHDISALAQLAGCNPVTQRDQFDDRYIPPNRFPILVEVTPQGGFGLLCTLRNYDQVCQYLADGQQVLPTSDWVTRHVCAIAALTAEPGVSEPVPDDPDHPVPGSSTAATNPAAGIVSGMATKPLTHRVHLTKAVSAAKRTAHPAHLGRLPQAPSRAWPFIAGP